AESCRNPRRTLRVKRDAAVALALRRVEHRMRSARRGERARHIGRGAPDFLQADDVPRLDACEPSRKALAFGRAQAVDVERDDAHARCGKSQRVYRTAPERRRYTRRLVRSPIER